MSDTNTLLVPAHAQRLSGLSERSNGDGRSRATVTHAMATGDIRLGRIRRSERQFLCRAWNPWGISEDKAGTPMTCRECAKILKRNGLDVSATQNGAKQC